MAPLVRWWSGCVWRRLPFCLTICAGPLLGRETGRRALWDRESWRIWSGIFAWPGKKVCPFVRIRAWLWCFCGWAKEVHITGGSLRGAVDEGIRRGYVNGRLRCSVVADPLRRENTGDNTPAVLHVEVVEGDEFTLTLAPKGFGSENMSAMRMFTPAATREDMEDWIASCVDTAGSNPCPPVIVGVGIGGTIEQCALEAKKALLMPMDQPNPDPYYADMEEKTLEKINALGIGPQGMGGRITALGVHIRPTATHIAGLPCVVNMSCHVTRTPRGNSETEEINMLLERTTLLEVDIPGLIRLPGGGKPRREWELSQKNLLHNGKISAIILDS